MTTSPQPQILSERILTTTPVPGEELPVVALTYRQSPLPPATLFIQAGELPDIKYLLEHPDESQAPPDLVKKGEAVRQKKIQEATGRRRASRSTR